MQALAPFAKAIDVHLFDTRAREPELKGTGILWKHDPFSDESWNQDYVTNLNAEKGFIDHLPLNMRGSFMDLCFFNDVDACFSKIQLAALQMTSEGGVKTVIKQAYQHWTSREDSIPENNFGSVLSSSARLNTVHADGFNNIVQLTQLHERYVQATHGLDLNDAKLQATVAKQHLEQSTELHEKQTGELIKVGMEAIDEAAHNAAEATIHAMTKIGDDKRDDDRAPGLPVVKRSRQTEGTTEVQQTQRPTKRAKVEEKKATMNYIPILFFAALAGVVIYKF